MILSRNGDFIPRPSGKDKADVKAKCFDVQFSFPCVGLGVGEWPAERQRSIWDGGGGREVGKGELGRIGTGEKEEG